MQFLITALLFTIHFATINTKVKKQRKEIKNKFTIHFATINTGIGMKFLKIYLLFTIQKQESIQSVVNIRFLDIFCVLTVHYSNRQI